MLDLEHKEGELLIHAINKRIAALEKVIKNCQKENQDVAAQKIMEDISTLHGIRERIQDLW